MSAIAASAARRPICSPVAQSVRKCTPSTSTSMLATTRPSGAATIAASSPGPSSVLAGWLIPAVTASMTANSPADARVPVAA